MKTNRTLTTQDRQLQSLRWARDNSFVLTALASVTSGAIGWLVCAWLLLQDQYATWYWSYWMRFLWWYNTEGSQHLLTKMKLAPKVQDVAMGMLFFERHSVAVNVTIGVSVVCFFLPVFLMAKYGANKKTYVKTQADEKDLATLSQLKSEIKAASKRKQSEFLPTRFDFTVPKLGLRIPDRSLASMLGVVGGAGSGKTNFIRQFVQSRREIDGKSLIVDINGEYFAKFGRPGDIVLSLYDVRSCLWDLWAEGIPMSDVAEALMEMGEGGKQQGTGEFFNSAGHAVLTTLMEHTDSAEELWELIQKPREDVMAFLTEAKGLAIQMLGSNMSGQTSGVLASSVKNLSFLKDLNAHAKARMAKSGQIEEAFSISKWVREDSDKRWVFLICTDATLAATRTLLRTWFSIATKAIMARPEDVKKERIYFVCDELASVGRLPRLADFLTATRRKNARAVLGFQALSQLNNLYGEQDMRTIIQGLQNLVVFRCSDPNLAQFMADRIGKIEVVEAAYSHSEDLKSGRYQASIAERIRDKYVLSANKIMNLEIGHAVLCLSEFSPCKVQFARIDMPSVSESAEAFTQFSKTNTRLSRLNGASGGSLLPPPRASEDSVSKEPESSDSENDETDESWKI